MSNMIDFTKKKKEFFTVKIPDGDKITTLLVATPTKKLLSKLTGMEGVLNDIEKLDNEESLRSLDCIYECCAALMSRNKGGILISQKQLEECLDIEDIMIFLNSYMQFVSEQIGRKN